MVWCLLSEVRPAARATRLTPDEARNVARVRLTGSDFLYQGL